VSFKYAAHHQLSIIFDIYCSEYWTLKFVAVYGLFFVFVAVSLPEK